MKPLAATLLALALALSAAHADPLDKARRHAGQREYLEAIAQAMDVARSPKQTAERRFEGFRTAAEAYLQIQCPRLAAATYHQALVALGGHDEHAAEAWWRIAEIAIDRDQLDDAEAFLTNALAELDLDRLPAQHRARLLRAHARCLEKLGRLRQALAVAQAVASAATRPDDLGEALAGAARIHAELHQFGQARACLARLGKVLDNDSARQEAARAYQELAERLVQAGRRKDARALCARGMALFGRTQPDTARQLLRRLLSVTRDDAAVMDVVAALEGDAALALASEHELDQLVPIAARSSRADGLVRACTRAMLARPMDESVARACLGAIVDLRIRQGQHGQALAAAWACYSVTGFQSASSSSFDAAVGLVAHALRARDGHLASGNTFRSYQAYGPAGPDRKPGTADDLANPLASLAPKPQPALDPLFEAALEAQPPTLEGTRTRGWIHLLWCKPRKALGELKRAFALCPLDSPSLARAAQDIALGLKALHATPAGMDAFARFQRHGPQGPDAKAGTADDLKDPLAGY